MKGKRIIFLIGFQLALAYLVHGQAPKDDSVKVFTSWHSLAEAIQPESEDQLVIVNFWATWCKPCVAELPYFNEISQREAPNDKIKVILVSLDMPTQRESRLYPFLQKHRIHPDVYLLDDPNANAWIDLVDPSWSGAIPATLCVKGREKWFHEGSFLSVADIDSFITQ